MQLDELRLPLLLLRPLLSGILVVLLPLLLLLVVLLQVRLVRPEILSFLVNLRHDKHHLLVRFLAVFARDRVGRLPLLLHLAVGDHRSMKPHKFLDGTVDILRFRLWGLVGV